jgi:tetratricopeptide (TPR) repeat protein
MLENVTLSSLFSFYMYHLYFSSLIAGICAYFLRIRYEDRWLKNFLFLLFFNMAIPGIGYLFTLWLSYYLLTVEFVKVLKNTKMLNMEELDQEFPRVKRGFGEGSMVELMSNALAPQTLRMRALSTMAENMTQKNVALIKHSLSDKDDEIRLYSFSLISNMEQALNTKVHHTTLRYKNSRSADEKLAAAGELAFLYWEMIYFDLSDEILKKYLVEESYKYARELFVSDMSNTSINVLLGKIHLMRKEYEQATTHFIIAIENGVKREYIIPYLAELYFQSGNYKSIRSMLGVVGELEMNATLYPVVEQWRAHG